MPFHRPTPSRTDSGPWNSQLIHLSEDDRPVPKRAAQNVSAWTRVFTSSDGRKTASVLCQWDLHSDLSARRYARRLRLRQARTGIPRYGRRRFSAGKPDRLRFGRDNAIPDEDFFKVETGYDVYDDIAGYETYADKFEQVYNRNAAQAVKADIDQEKKDRETLAASGWTN